MLALLFMRIAYGQDYAPGDRNFRLNGIAVDISLLRKVAVYHEMRRKL